VDARHDPEWEAVTEILKDIPRSWLVRETGLDRSTITRLRNGHTSPHPEHRAALTRAASNYMRLTASPREGDSL
jgi:hypothetical protein